MTSTFIYDAVRTPGAPPVRSPGRPDDLAAVVMKAPSSAPASIPHVLNVIFGDYQAGEDNRNAAPSRGPPPRSQASPSTGFASSVEP